MRSPASQWAKHISPFHPYSETGVRFLQHGTLTHSCVYQAKAGLASSSAIYFPLLHGTLPVEYLSRYRRVLIMGVLTWFSCCFDCGNMTHYEDRRVSWWFWLSVLALHSEYKREAHWWFLKKGICSSLLLLSPFSNHLQISFYAL